MVMFEKYMLLVTIIVVWITFLIVGPVMFSGATIDMFLLFLSFIFIIIPLTYVLGKKFYEIVKKENEQ